MEKRQRKEESGMVDDGVISVQMCIRDDVLSPSSTLLSSPLLSSPLMAWGEMMNIRVANIRESHVHEELLEFSWN